MTRAPSLRVAVLAYDGCFAAEVFGLTDVLLIANRVATGRGLTEEPFDVSVVGARDGVVHAAGGHSIGVARTTRRELRRCDALVVPGFELLPGDDEAVRLGDTRAEQELVAAVADRGADVSSVCVGAFLLGEVGALDERRATTSWLFASELAARYPRATVTPEAMMVTDGHVTTTAAFSAVHDLAMELVRRHAGESVARTTARVTLIPGNRTSQAPHVDRATVAETDQFSLDVHRYLTERLADPYDLAALAAAFHVSTRTLLRRFAAEQGRSPLEHLQDLRVEAAKRLLESTDGRVQDVMERVGYHDAGTFRRLFAARVGVTPAAYRRQFRTG